jgi:hypothetical protein
MSGDGVHDGFDVFGVAGVSVDRSLDEIANPRGLDIVSNHGAKPHHVVCLF